ncbi:MAG: hypothetical protein AB1391_03970 [Candidatus Micrarchaeota archaeon]
MKILVFGNPFINGDSIVFNIVKKLKRKFCFKILESVEDIENEGKNLLILDSAEGISKICILKDLDRLETNALYSMHDFDIALTLKLLKKIGKIESVTIIAVPKGYALKKALIETELAITKL